MTGRRQLRWIVWGSTVGALPFVFIYVLPFLVGHGRGLYWHRGAGETVGEEPHLGFVGARQLQKQVPIRPPASCRDPRRRSPDLGPEHFIAHWPNPERRAYRLAFELRALGHEVTLAS